MSGRIILIVEGQNDGAIATRIIMCKYPHIKPPRIIRPTGNNPNLSHLAEQIYELISTAIQIREQGGCIAVVHDKDLLTRPHNRADYERIEQACTEKHITRIEAHDELNHGY